MQMILVYPFEEIVWVFVVQICNTGKKLFDPIKQTDVKSVTFQSSIFISHLSNVLSLNQRVDTLNTGCAWLCPDKHVSTVLFVYLH